MIDDLERWLAEITGFDAVSLQPNAGSQGEYAGLLAIRALSPLARRRPSHHLPDPLLRARHQSGERGDGRHERRRRALHRRTATSTWTTCGPRPNEHSKNLAALMFTYPSTHGVFEEGARDLCAPDP